ncbi:hypothetical protein CKM354_001124900 [Cercospora kikuchii]|uniref:Aminotransferase n=1 Tax=Cercospora kikuchii TaxID=84275 RepID=A0A9P3CV73_9PEZI|nr:uncharacterized protein CKM354_001124500 [Cercospora kikuchii]XP_044662663.1 uncharacterized protein CKM354_001124900 [Cercospora kikuchii]GIZ48172.1 hypothetical protein CKM354_001124500 [Cercospora kikuchii]GIZ48176.1 hypothetical protein CKM354_001124900 [Cercospora kikuchii]
MSTSTSRLNNNDNPDQEASRLYGITPPESQKSAVLHRKLHQNPRHVVASQGHFLQLSNGQEILAACDSPPVASNLIRIQHALVKQMQEVSYCHSHFYATRAAEDLAKLLADSTQGEMAYVFSVSSGSEAMEAALKMAHQYYLEKPNPEPERIHFISRHCSYHGSTLGALAASGHAARRAPFEPVLATSCSQVSPCYAYRNMDLGTDHTASYLKRLEAELDAEFQRIGPRAVAVFIIEPIVGAALGCVPPVAGYCAAIRQICDKYGALLIFDEVMCGVGRTGPEPTARFPQPLHAWQDPLIGVVPDIQTIGKGLGGGYMPVAAMLASRRVGRALERGTGAFVHGQTYQSHPLACKAALAAQKIILQENFVANVRKQGLLLDLGVAMGLHELGLQSPFNISLYPGTGSADGHRGDHILLAPAYTVTSDEIRHIVETLTAVVTKLFENLFDSGRFGEERIWDENRIMLHIDSFVATGTSK